MKFLAEGDGVGPVPISFNYKHLRLREVLESIGALHDWRWSRVDSNTLALRPVPVSQTILNLLRPHTAVEADIFRHGREFLHGLSELSPQMQQAIRNRDAGGVAFSSLPGPIQNSISAMLAAETAGLAERGEKYPVSQHDLDGQKILLSNESRNDGYSSHSIDLSYNVKPNIIGSTQISFRVFDKILVGQDEVIPRPDPFARWFELPRGLLDIKQAAAQEARLKQRTSLKMKNATLPEALQDIGAKADFPFILSYGAIQRIERSFDLKEMPLGELLDRLLALYAIPLPQQIPLGAKELTLTWGVRKSGVFMFYPERPITTEKANREVR